MNTELFIARKIIKGDKLSGNISKPIVKIAILGIALGIAVMILAVAIVTGFKSQIRDKVIGFGAHIQIHYFDSNSSFEPKPISKNQDFYPGLASEPGIRHIQVYATKPGIIKTSEDIEGVVVKGIGSDFDWSFFNDKIVEGKSFTVSDTAKSNEILISSQIASKLKLNAGDDLVMYFVQQPPRMRKFNISGIYQTGLEEFDKLYVIADIAHIQKLNDWEDDQVGGFEVLINNYDDLEVMTELVRSEIGYDLNAENIRERTPQVFDWLDLQDVNVKIILILMILVAGINMISTLLILILERTGTIGVLKSLGMKDKSIQKIFLYNATYIVGRGMLWGNLIGLLICFIQYKFEVFKLDEANYYLSAIPIHLDIWSWLLLNVGTLSICVLMLILPSYIISKITPVKVLRFS